MGTGNVKPIIFEVPLTPPSVNHYKVPVWIRTQHGRIRGYALTPEALAFHQAIAIFARGRSLTPETASECRAVRYSITATVFLGKGQRGDGDNFWKCLADGLVKAGVIHSDARVRTWHLEVEDERRDQQPRTLICVKVMEAETTLAEILQEMES